MSRYDLKPITSKEEPVVFFGMYDKKDLNVFESVKAKKIIVWCGSDAMKLKATAAAIVDRADTKHIAMSRYVSDDLTKYDILHITLPVTPQDKRLDCVPRGNHIYHYGDTSDFYRTSWVPIIEQRTGIRVISTNASMYTWHELKQVYAQCFVALRLTDHDGCPNTVVEMGLMGRRSIYNGGLPNCIPWVSVGDVCDAVTIEYHKRHEPNRRIAEDMANYINIGNDWLKV